MRIRNLKVIEEWCPERAKLRRKYFFKDEVFFGTDKAADIRIERPGLGARLSFSECEFEDFQTTERKRLEENELLQWGGRIFAWRSCRISKKLFLTLFLCLVLFGGFFLFSSERQCFEEEVDPRFSHKVRAFRSLLTSKNLLAARAKWIEMREEFSAGKCLEPSFKQLEIELIENQLLQELSRTEYVAAAELLANLREKYASDLLGVMEDRIVAGAADLFWSAWRLEKSDPGASYRLNKEAQEICVLLKLERSCFLPGEAKSP